MTEVSNPETLEQLGDNLIALGNALKSPALTRPRMPTGRSGQRAAHSSASLPATEIYLK